MSQHDRTAPSSNVMRGTSPSTSAYASNYHQSGMAPNSSAVRRNSTFALTGAPNYQNGRILQRRPNTIPLNRDKISKIYPKLKAFRAEHEKLQSLSGLDVQGSNDIIAQAMQKRAPKNNRGPSSISAQSEQSFTTDMTVDTERTSVTIIFDGNTGQETQEKVKKQLDPVLKSRKDLLRAIGTCKECRNKKIKCFLSHHALEDLLNEYPEAEDDVRWGLETDTDPKHFERNITSSTGHSPTGNGNLDFLMEEDSNEAGIPRRDVVGFGQVDEMFGLSDTAQPTTYNPNLVVESVGDLKSPDNDFFAAGNLEYDNAFADERQFQPSPALHDLFGTGSQAQSFMGNNTFELPSDQNDFAMRQRASSINRANPIISLVPSVSYEGTFSAPQSAFLEGHHYTYSQPSSLAGGTDGSFQSTDQTIDAFLASFNGHFFKCLISSNMAASSLCGRESASLPQMIFHIQQSHADYSIGMPSPLRAVCPNCCSFYAQTERMCNDCRQQTLRFICGTSPIYESQLSRGTAQSFGNDGMDFNSMSYEF